MSNRLQENAVERLSLQYGAVCVDDGFADGIVRATVPTGAHFFINEDGIANRKGATASITWDAPGGSRMRRGLPDRKEAGCR